MQYTYTKLGLGEGSLFCQDSNNKQSIDVSTRDLLTPGDIQTLERKLQSKFVRRVGDTHYLFKK